MSQISETVLPYLVNLVKKCLAEFYHCPVFALAFILSLNGEWVFCQHKSVTDSIKSVLEGHSQEDSIKVTLLNELGFQLHYENKEEAVLTIKEALNIAQKIGFEYGEARSYTMLSTLHAGRSEYDSALYHYQLGLKIATKLENDTLIGGLHNNLGLMHLEYGNYLKAIDYLMKALNHYEAAGFLKGAVVAMNNLGLIHMQTKSFDQALNYYREAHSLSTEIDYQEASAMTLANMGYVHFSQKDYRTALDHLNSALTKAYENNFREIISICYRREGEIFIEQKNLANAEKLILESLSICRDVEDNVGIIQDLNLLANINLERDRYEKALNYAKKALEVSKRFESFSYSSQTNLTASKIYSALGNADLALKHYQTYSVLKDSLYNADKIKQMSVIQAEYDIRSRDKDIQLLQQKNEIQSLQMARQKNLTWIFFATVAVLLIIATLLFYLFRLRQHEKEQIQEKNKIITQSLEDKERLIREIHHRVKNNLQIVQSILDTQSIELVDQSAATALQESKSRVQTISLIHQYLYQTNEINLDIRNYLQQLIQYIRESLMPSSEISVKCSIDSFRLDADWAVSIGLIINEALTNSLKHGFQDHQNGEVHIRLEKKGNDTFTMEIADNGVGLPEDFKDRRQNSMGFRLIEGLTKHLDGVLEVVSANGTKLTFVFPFDAMKSKAA